MKTNPSKNLIGMKFGRLTVIEFMGIKQFWRDRRESHWKVRCECGKEKILRINNLRNVKSCGCLLDEFRHNILPSKTRERNSKPLGEAAKNRCWNNYKQRAKKKNIEFEFSREEFLALTQQNCYYCGREPRTVIKNSGKKRVNGTFTYNGIDRIDSNLGYTKNNSVTCCEICNKAKRDLSQHDFISWINDLTNYRRNND